MNYVPLSCFNYLDFSEITLFWVMQLDATGRPDESLAMEFIGPLRSKAEHNLQNGKLLSFSLQKGQLKANIYFQPFHSANLEVTFLKNPVFFFLLFFYFLLFLFVPSSPLSLFRFYLVSLLM